MRKLVLICGRYAADMRPICGRYAESGPKYLAKIALFLIFFLQARPHKLTIHENGIILLNFLYLGPGKAPQTNEFQKSVCFLKKHHVFLQGRAPGL